MAEHELDLEGIRARLRAIDHNWPHTLIDEDIPALIAEIERLRAQEKPEVVAWMVDVANDEHSYRLAFITEAFAKHEVWAAQAAHADAVVKLRPLTYADTHAGSTQEGEGRRIRLRADGGLDGETMHYLAKFCLHCGDPNSRCQCWNDE